MNITSIIVAASLTSFQSAGSGPLLFGPVGRTLAAAEIAQIEAVAHRAVERKPWLIVGFRSMLMGRASVTVYLEPDTHVNRMRRGKMLHLIADEPPAAARRSQWRIESTASYAHIVLLGRTPNEITSERDIGWPFAVEGEIDDKTLFSLVAFIRSNPAIPGVPEGHAPRAVDGMWPISAVRRTEDTFLVNLRTSEFTGQTVTLRRFGSRWAITNYAFWIV